MGQNFRVVCFFCTRADIDYQYDLFFKHNTKSGVVVSNLKLGISAVCTVFNQPKLSAFSSDS